MYRHNVVARRSAAVAKLMIGVNLASPCLAISRANSSSRGALTSNPVYAAYIAIYCRFAENVKQNRINGQSTLLWHNVHARCVFGSVASFQENLGPPLRSAGLTTAPNSRQTCLIEENVIRYRQR